MKLYVHKALWGMTGSLSEQLFRIAEAGYDGIDAWMDPRVPDPAAYARQVEQAGLRLIVAAPITTISEIEPKLQGLAEFAPVKINIHSGLDSMSFDEGCAFFEAALEVQSRLSIPVVHETHRGRLLFTPWVTAAYLERFPELRINADYSHWVNVCERLPNDQASAMVLANSRAGYIHGRVGYEEGPQVPDPAAPEYAAPLAWHETQWQAIRAAHIQAGAESLTFTPEYGPPTYLHTLPHTNEPVADLWNICLWAADRARQILSD